MTPSKEDLAKEFFQKIGDPIDVHFSTSPESCFYAGFDAAEFLYKEALEIAEKGLESLILPLDGKPFVPTGSFAHRGSIQAREILAAIRKLREG